MTKGELIEMLKADEGPDDRLVWVSVLGAAESYQTMAIGNVTTVIPHNGNSNYIDVVAGRGDRDND
jgi:hypothetical protein